MLTRKTTAKLANAPDPGGVVGERTYVAAQRLVAGSSGLLG